MPRRKGIMVKKHGGSGGVLQEMKREARLDVHRFPSPFQATMGYPLILRYRMVAGTVINPVVTRKNLLDIFVQGNTTTSYARSWSAVRIRKLEIWGGTVSTTATTNSVAMTNVSIEWLSTYGPGRVKSDAGNFERPPHIESRPPRGSLAGFWSLVGSGETDVLFKLSGSSTGPGSAPFSGLPLGTIVDLHLQVMNQDDEAVVVYTGITGVTAGQNYVRDFTTAPGATEQFSPEGYTSTV